MRFGRYIVGIPSKDSDLSYPSSDSTWFSKKLVTAEKEEEESSKGMEELD